MGSTEQDDEIQIVPKFGLMKNKAYVTRDAAKTSASGLITGSVAIS
jgi:hypothetical protein